MENNSPLGRLKRTLPALAIVICALSPFSIHPAIGTELDASAFMVCVSNEKSGDISILDGKSQQVIATIPVGKRPRGIHPGPDGKILYVALSGSPISGPPPLDAKGNPILRKGDDDDDDKNADHSADGIGMVDLQQMKFL